MIATILATTAFFTITTPQTDSLPRIPELDQTIVRLMIKEDVKGLGVAVTEKGEITHLATYGYRNVEKKLPLAEDTIMYGASLTKAAFAYMVLQLVEEGILNLDTPINSYLPNPLPTYPKWQTLKGDHDWRQLTARLLLSHQSGLANLRFLEPDRDLKFHFKPGDYYAYSGEGFRLLQFVLEEGLNIDVKHEMQTRIFSRFNMPNTDMQWRDSFADNLADGYAVDGSFEPHDERSNVSASGSMDTTLKDQANMWKEMAAGRLLSKAVRTEWTKPQINIHSKQKFPTLTYTKTQDPRAADINLAAGLGVITWKGPKGHYFSKDGHNGWTGNLVICEEENERCLIMLSNSVRAEIIFPEITKMVLGETAYPWWWVYPSYQKPELTMK